MLDDLAGRPTGRRSGRLVVVVFTAAALLVGAVSQASAAPTPADPREATPRAAGFVPLHGAGLINTRSQSLGRSASSGDDDALIAGRRVTLPVRGRHGVPAMGVGAVVLSVTGTALQSGTTMTLHPSGAPTPEVDSLAVDTPGEPVARTMITTLGADGALQLLADGAMDISVDLVGWFPEGAAVEAGAARRLLDTRTEDGGGPVLDSAPRPVTVSLGGGPSGTTALLDVTASDATSPTAVAAWAADGAARSATAAINLRPGETRRNQAVVPVGRDGRIMVGAVGGSAQVTIDVVALLPASVAHAVVATRVFDSRSVSESGAANRLRAEDVRQISVVGHGGVPSRNVAAVLVNVTSIAPGGTAAIGLWGSGPPPTSAALVAPAGQVRSGFAAVPVDEEGKINIGVVGVDVDAIIDVVGWLPGTPGEPQAEDASSAATAIESSTAAPATTSEAAVTRTAAPRTTAPRTPATRPSPSVDEGLLPSVRDLLFDGDLAKGLSNYKVQACRDDSVQVVDDPLGVVRKVARFNVRNSDTSPCTPTENPRAQIVSPNIIREGGDYWIGWSTLFPEDYPSWPGHGWVTFESVYGPPFNDSGPRHMALLGDPERIVWQRASSYGYDLPWSMPMVRGRWIDFVVHQVQSEDEAEGLVELWVNTGEGFVRQRFTDGSETLHTRTVDDPNNGGPNTSDVRLYFERDMYPEATLFHAEHRVGRDFRSVAPSSYADQEGS